MHLEKCTLKNEPARGDHAACLVSGSFGAARGASQFVLQAPGRPPSGAIAFEALRLPARCFFPCSSSCPRPHVSWRSSLILAGPRTVPKTAGSTVRKQLGEAATRLGFTGERDAPIGSSGAPRYELYDHNLRTFQIAQASILAGHLTFGTVQRILSERFQVHSNCTQGHISWFVVRPCAHSLSHT